MFNKWYVHALNDNREYYHRVTNQKHLVQRDNKQLLER